MRTLLGLVFGAVAIAFVFTCIVGLLGLLWWLFVVAAMVAVAGVVWRAVTQN